MVRRRQVLGHPPQRVRFFGLLEDGFELLDLFPQPLRAAPYRRKSLRALVLKLTGRNLLPDSVFKGFGDARPGMLSRGGSVLERNGINLFGAPAGLPQDHRRKRPPLE